MLTHVQTESYNYTNSVEAEMFSKHSSVCQAVRSGRAGSYKRTGLLNQPPQIITSLHHVLVKFSRFLDRKECGEGSSFTCRAQSLTRVNVSHTCCTECPVGTYENLRPRY